MFFSALIRFLQGPNFNGQPHVSQRVTNTHAQNTRRLKTDDVLFFTACRRVSYSHYVSIRHLSKAFVTMATGQRRRSSRHEASTPRLSLPPHLSLCSAAKPHGKAPALPHTPRLAHQTPPAVQCRKPRSLCSFRMNRYKPRSVLFCYSFWTQTFLIHMFQGLINIFLSVHIFSTRFENSRPHYIFRIYLYCVPLIKWMKTKHREDMRVHKILTFLFESEIFCQMSTFMISSQ